MNELSVPRGWTDFLERRDKLLEALPIFIMGFCILIQALQNQQCEILDGAVEFSFLRLIIKVSIHHCSKSLKFNKFVFICPIYFIFDIFICNFFCWSSGSLHYSSNYYCYECVEFYINDVTFNHLSITFESLIFCCLYIKPCFNKISSRYVNIVRHFSHRRAKMFLFASIWNLRQGNTIFVQILFSRMLDLCRKTSLIWITCSGSRFAWLIKNKRA